MRQFLLDQRRLFRAQYKATVRPIMLLFAHESTPRSGFAATKRPDNKSARPEILVLTRFFTRTGIHPRIKSEGMLRSKRYGYENGRAKKARPLVA
jgi:hypothetical protein